MIYFSFLRKVLESPEKKQLSSKKIVLKNNFRNIRGKFFIFVGKKYVDLDRKFHLFFKNHI